VATARHETAPSLDLQTNTNDTSSELALNSSLDVRSVLRSAALRHNRPFRTSSRFSSYDQAKKFLGKEVSLIAEPSQPRSIARGFFTCLVNFDFGLMTVSSCLRILLACTGVRKRN
jgi:hypothetical protein